MMRIKDKENYINKNDPEERDRSKCFHNGIILIVIRFNLMLSYNLFFNIHSK